MTTDLMNLDIRKTALAHAITLTCGGRGAMPGDAAEAVIKAAREFDVFLRGEAAEKVAGRKKGGGK